MTDKAKLEEVKKLADAMYYAAQYLTTDASRLHKAMEEYHQFIIHEWREEPVSEDLKEAAKDYFEHAPKDQVHLITDAFKNGAKWDREKIINKVVEWLKENVHKYADSFVDSFELCKDLKQILEED